MKNLFFTLLIALSFTCSAQIQFNKTEYFNVGIAVDPVASIKDKGLNIGAQIEAVMYWGYVRASVQHFSIIDGKYTDIIGSGGINLRTGIFDPVRWYAGGRLGVIKRGGYTYPTYGIEAGFEYGFDNGLNIGLRSTYDYRSDFEFWGGESEMRPSGFITISYIFKRLR